MGVTTAVDATVRAIFAYEFDDLDSVDTDTVAAIRAGYLDDWVRGVADSGLLSNDSVRAVEAAWRANPEILVDALLDGVDEVTRRRIKASRRPVVVVAEAIPAS